MTTTITSSMLCTLLICALAFCVIYIVHQNSRLKYLESVLQNQHEELYVLEKKTKALKQRLYVCEAKDQKYMRVK